MEDASRFDSAETDGDMPASAHTTPRLRTDTLAMVEPWRGRRLEEYLGMKRALTHR